LAGILPLLLVLVLGAGSLLERILYESENFGSLVQDVWGELVLVELVEFTDGGEEAQRRSAPSAISTKSKIYIIIHHLSNVELMLR
jgi:hypothetical protein